MTSRFDAETVARISQRTGEPEWLAARRREAFARFESLPWPDQSAEEWRHTDIRGLDLDLFDALPDPHPEVGELEDLPEAVRGVAIGKKGDRLGLGIRLDADLVHSRLSPKLAEAGVVLGQLEHVARDQPELVE